MGGDKSGTYKQTEAAVNAYVAFWNSEERTVDDYFTMFASEGDG